MNVSFTRVAAAAVLAGSALSAQALTLNLSDYANGSVSTQGIYPPSGTFNTGAGAFKGSLTDAPGFNANPFYTYCVELSETFGFGNLTGYTIVAGASYFSATVLARLEDLFSSLPQPQVGMPPTTDKSAGWQIAVWESIYETDATLDTTVGSFDVSNTSAGARTAAGDALTAAANYNSASLYSISVLSSVGRPGQQDFLLIQRIPEPTTLALVALALVGLGASTRRRYS